MKSFQNSHLNTARVLTTEATLQLTVTLSQPSDTDQCNPLPTNLSNKFDRGVSIGRHQPLHQVLPTGDARILLVGFGRIRPRKGIDELGEVGITKVS